MDKGLVKDMVSVKKRDGVSGFDNLVSEKDIFANVFEKDIRRIYIYKKAERIAKALHMIGPAFRSSASLKERLERISIALVDASVVPPGEARERISRELLALGSLLSMAKAGGHLSSLNADIIMREAHLLLSEVASYEPPAVSFEDSPTLASLARSAPKAEKPAAVPSHPSLSVSATGALSSTSEAKGHKGQIKDNGKKNGRREEILSVLRSKGTAYIKDISMLMRGISEKTVQRELQILVSEGVVEKSGERRWTTYSVAPGQ